MTVENVTPVLYVVPAPAIAKRPRPATTTSTLDGLQPPLSAKRTEKVMFVDGVPEPGDALPAVSVGVVAPLQTPARAELEVVGSMRTTRAAATARPNARAVRSRIQ
jgi:hypothetical protein